MFKTLLIFLVGIIPPIISVWAIGKLEARAQERLRIAIERASFASLAISSPPPDLSYLGDPTCQFNARSPYLRCAINPAGPCQDCLHYQERE